MSDEQAGLPYSEAYENKLEQYLARSAEERKRAKGSKNASGAVHDYKPEDYGLTTAQIREEFKEYIAKYKLVE